MRRNRQLGQVTIAILKAIADGRAFGLDIMGATSLPSGTVYPTLARLEDRGLVDARWEDDRIAQQEGRPRRRYYQITAAGTAALGEALRRLEFLATGSPSEPAARDA